MGLQQVFINFANLYQRFIQGFTRIATSLTAILKTTGSSVVSAFRVDDNEIVGSGGMLELKLVEVLSNEKWTQLPQITGLIAKEAPTKVSDKYVTL